MLPFALVDGDILIRIAVLIVFIRVLCVVYSNVILLCESIGMIWCICSVLQSLRAQLHVNFSITSTI